MPAATTILCPLAAVKPGELSEVASLSTQASTPQQGARELEQSELLCSDPRLKRGDSEIALVVELLEVSADDGFVFLLQT
jgi:hypothetical protein